ncbi:S-methyl-5-thioribose-1-phosphate isomerase [Lentisphaerota bacterium ZTH]|nr:S-methyl-5-thioribose-1-phosphate isomerase [Lentisphaerota bacterium]WET07429.1 S-methyl-5-thioribose-1-phosphate isomerase [Lentisphaerota bacterium ZTH]
MLDPVSWITENGQIVREYTKEIDTCQGKLRLIDQTLLPEKLVYVELDETEAIFDAIKRLVVRGAPAIGCAAAVGVAAVVRKSASQDAAVLRQLAITTADRLAESRPTAVNLFWALKKIKDAVSGIDNAAELRSTLLQTALNILDEDIAMCRAIGSFGAELLKDDMTVLTHCNAGALATGDYGTALSPVYVASENGMNIKVYSDETRPLLQGSRLTAWELNEAGVDVTTICDNMTAQVMKEGKVDMVIVGADRIAANGDAANKIGTYGVAILAEYHNIPFYVAAPYSTFDLSLESGDEIPIEQRDGDEVRKGCGKLTAPEEVNVYNPAFDVTPNELIAGIITEKGIIRAPFEENIKKILG